MDDLTKRFLALFAEAEKLVASAAGRSSGRNGFSSNLTVAQQKDIRFRRFSEELRVSADVRNLLSHQRFRSDYPVAPSPSLTKALEHAVTTLKNPPKVINHFRPKELREFSPEDDIAEVLAYTTHHNFSQVLVRRSGKLDLLSSNTIHRWLASCVDVELVDLNIPVSKVLRFKEPKRTEIQFSNRHTDLFDALSLFQGGQAKSLLALVITERGKSEEKPLAFVTPWDLGELSRLLGGTPN